MLTTLELPPDWYKIPIGKNTSVFVNMRQQIASIAPVFHLNQLEKVLRDGLGIKIEYGQVDQEVVKMQKSLPQANVHPVLHINENAITNAEQLQALSKVENEKVSKILEEELKKLDLQIQVQLKDVAGENKDEISLLNAIAGKSFQCIPQYTALEQTSDNPFLRYYCSVRINGREVGRGIAQSKKQAKYLAAIQALKIICPTLYLEWKKSYKPNDPELATLSQNSVNATQDSKTSSQNSQIMPTDKIRDKENILVQDEDAEAIDCEIDDPNLLTTKKHLLKSTSPVQIVNSLKAKHKTLGFDQQSKEQKDLEKNQLVYTVTFKLKGYDFEGTASEYNKKRAEHMAAQRFIKKLFPTLTWIKMVEMIQTLKEPLKQILNL